MYRFLLPAFVMISAIVVLLAGALGGVPSLPDLKGQWAAYFTSPAPEHTIPPADGNTHVASVAPPKPAASVSPPTPTAPDDQASQRPAADTLHRQAAALQSQIAQRSRELASLNDSADQARRELDALHQQKQAEEVAVSQLQARQKQTAAVVPQETPGRPQPAPQSAPARSGNPPVQAAQVRPRVTAQYSRRQAQPVSAAPRQVASQPEQTQTPRDDLVNARELLVSGRAADARQMLVLAQAQSELRPVTPDQPFATGGSVTATRISDAIRYLDRGNARYALRAINMAMDGTTTGTHAWPAAPSGQPVYR
jgi:hypothetical protein